MHGGVGTVVVFFGASAWDIVQNHGAWSRMVVGAFTHLARALGVL
jgi:hypothetical protein